jgi:hypothetical protein
LLPQANSWEIGAGPVWPEQDVPPFDLVESTVDKLGMAVDAGDPAEATPGPRVAAAMRPPRPTAPERATHVPERATHVPERATRVPDTRSRFAANLRIGQLVCWQVALTLVGLTIGRPWPVAGPAAAGAAILLALTGLRWRRRWLYQWAARYLRFRTRARRRYLPREDGLRALLHLLAPDATLTSTRLDDGHTAVVSRNGGATAVLRPRLAGADPVEALPRPEELLGGTERLALAMQLVFHGVAGNRRSPLGWIAVQAIRTPELSEEDAILRVLTAAVEWVSGRLAERDVAVDGFDQATMLGTVASLAHVSDDRGQVRERWRYWHCGPIAQAGFRLDGWAALPDAESRLLLRRLLTATTGAVVTVAVAAGTVDGEPGPEAATLRVAASSVERLERSVTMLRALASPQDVRLDRMNGEHLEGVVASLPLGTPR